MARRDQFTKTSSNPSKYFLEWASDNKCLRYYDKEKSENVLIKLPFKFLVIQQMHTVRGWDESRASGIYSNEVEFIGQETLTVKTFKAGYQKTGLYRDIKEEIAKIGAHYCRSIYAMTPKGELININLKGAAVQSWGEFTQKTAKRLGDEWVIIAGHEDGKKGAVNYSFPKFEFSGSIDSESDKNAEKLYDELKCYFAKGGSSAPEVEVNEQASVENDDLPF